MIERDLIERIRDEFLNYETMKHNLMVAAMPIEGNEKLLKTIPHKVKEDLAMYYILVLCEDEEGMEYIRLTNDLMDIYGIDAEQLHEDAMLISQLNYPARIRRMSEVIAELMHIDTEMFEDNGGLLIASSHKKFGAGCIFYPDFPASAFHMLGGEYFIIPSSIDEVILLRDEGDIGVDELKGMVNNVNLNEVNPWEKLSDSVYKYDSKKNEIVRVG